MANTSSDLNQHQVSRFPTLSSIEREPNYFKRSHHGTRNFHIDVFPLGTQDRDYCIYDLIIAISQPSKYVHESSRRMRRQRSAEAALGTSSARYDFIVPGKVWHHNIQRNAGNLSNQLQQKTMFPKLKIYQWLENTRRSSVLETSTRSIA